MSWSIYAKGTKEQIRAILATQSENSGFPRVEQDQKKMAMDLISLTIDGAEVVGKGFNVEAFGSCTTGRDSEMLGNNVSVKIETINLE